MILAGRILVNEQKVDKSGALVSHDASVRILGNDLPYVSRGGLKLAHALQHWNIDVSGRTCMDIGSSTGGFTDCLLQNGASKVIAVDTGYGQMDLNLRSDVRVRLLEKTNARYLTAEQLWTGNSPREPVSVIAIDVSFISATLILPAVVQIGRTSGGPIIELITLIKPQFEVGREQVGKGGIVRDPEAQQFAARKVSGAVQELGGTEIDIIDSPILGAEGNREFLLHAMFAGLTDGVLYTDFAAE